MATIFGFMAGCLCVAGNFCMDGIARWEKAKVRRVMIVSAIPALLSCPVGYWLVGWFHILAMLVFYLAFWAPVLSLRICLSGRQKRNEQERS